MSLRDWIGSPPEWGEFGSRATSWLNELVTYVRDTTTDLTALTASVATNTTNIATNVTNIATNASNITSLSSTTTSVTFASGVGNLGAPYQVAVGWKERNGMVTVQGWLLNSTGIGLPGGTAVCQYPTGYRPASTIHLSGRVGTAHMRLDMNNVGQIIVQEATWTNGNYLAYGGTFLAA